MVILGMPVQTPSFAKSIMSRARSWCFTINNYTDEEYNTILNNPQAKYVIMGKEVGQQGTPHLQGYVQWKSGKTLEACKEVNQRGHWERMRGTHEQAIEYCKKEGNWEERGTPPKSGKRTAAERAEMNQEIWEKPLRELVREGIISIKEVRAIKNAKMDLALEFEEYEHETVRGVWIYGPPGTGKSHKARVDYPNAYRKAQNKWFDGYGGEEAIILDDLDTHQLGHYIKIWTDRWPCKGEVKSGTVQLQHKHFIITSNYHPRQIWDKALDPRYEEMCNAIIRRCEIIHMPFRQEEEKEDVQEDILDLFEN